jgi:hypothetical protein
MYKKKYISLEDTICPVCGKNFVPACEHAYSGMFGRVRKAVCSNHCANVAEANHEAELKQKHRYLKSERN